MERSGGIRIGLSAVVMALVEGRLCVLTTGGEGDDALALPFGPFDPDADRTFELALKAFVTRQTGFDPGYVEQLYTFGDAGRGWANDTSSSKTDREVSVGYLALARDSADPGTRQAGWTPVFDIFPWEDRRTPPSPDILDVQNRLLDGPVNDPDIGERSRSLLAAGPDYLWNEERVLERYELLYEAGRVQEARRDHPQTRHDETAAFMPGISMVSDHRRILATGLGRLRSKLKYRPVLFELMPKCFTLSELQKAAQAVVGLNLHKQNFRRGVERTGLVEPTGQLSVRTGGRPAELYRSTGLDPKGGQAPGLALPALR